MEGYFVIISHKNTMVHIDTIDVAERHAAESIKEYQEALGHHVSIWKGMRIYLTKTG